jgi:hypothetical protein
MPPRATLGAPPRKFVPAPAPPGLEALLATGEYKNNNNGLAAGYDDDNDDDEDGDDDQDRAGAPIQPWQKTMCDIGPLDSCILCGCVMHSEVERR